MTARDVTGLILAGGASRRFGTAKARYEVEGRTLIARVADALAEVVPAPLLVSVADAEAHPLPEYPTARYVADRYSEAGPLAGLHAGLHAAPTPWLLAVACDLPDLTPEVLRTILAARTSDADAIVARTPDGRLHPLCAAYHRRLLPSAEAHLADGRRALHDLLGAVHTREVPLPAAPLRNVNAPGDL